MKMPTSILQSVRRLPPKQTIPAKFNTISATINTIRDTPLNLVHLRILFSKSLLYEYQLHQFPSGPVYTGKHDKLFGFTKTV